MWKIYPKFFWFFSLVNEGDCRQRGFIRVPLLPRRKKKCILSKIHSSVKFLFCFICLNLQIQRIITGYNTRSFNFEKHLNNHWNINIYLCLTGLFNLNNYLFQLDFQIISINPSILTSSPATDKNRFLAPSTVVQWNKERLVLISYKWEARSWRSRLLLCCSGSYCARQQVICFESSSLSWFPHYRLVLHVL